MPKIWQAKSESLTSFGSKSNTSQNHGLPNLWRGKFWKRTNHAQHVLFLLPQKAFLQVALPVGQKSKLIFSSNHTCIVPTQSNSTYQLAKLIGLYKRYIWV
jgi:hypothetical protein